MRAIVIGAGMFGASTAYHLARFGAEVTVIDAAHPGAATRAGAGIICPWATAGTDPAFYRLYAAGGAHYPHLIRELDAAGVSDSGYRRVGGLILGTGPGGLDAVHARLEARLPEAPEAGTLRPLTGPEAAALFPALDGRREALHLSGAGRVEARTLADTLLSLARDAGARMIFGQAGLGIGPGTRPRVTLDGETLAADRVFLTGGAWAEALLAPLGLGQGVRPQKGQILHLDLPGEDTRDWPVLLPQTGHYMLAFGPHRVVVGATREDDGGFDRQVTAAGLAEILAAALAIAPGLGRARVLETRVGTRPLAAGVVPVIGTVPGVPGLFLGNGLGAWGLTAGPLAGRLLAQLGTDRVPDLDLAPYAPAGLRA